MYTVHGGKELNIFKEFRAGPECSVSVGRRFCPESCSQVATQRLNYKSLVNSSGFLLVQSYIFNELKYFIYPLVHDLISFHSIAWVSSFSLCQFATFLSPSFSSAFCLFLPQFYHVKLLVSQLLY